MASTSEAIAAREGALFRASLPTWIACVVAAVAAYFAFRHGVTTMLDDWASREEYSHAYLIPFIALFLAWQRKNELAALPFTGSWVGVGLVVLAVGVGIVGQLGSIEFFEQFGFVLAICGFVLALTGWRALRLLWMPLLLLFMMIPLPNPIQAPISAGMQLWSSAIGVWFVRLMGISVYLSGNVIDLGNYKLQVVEACDGLRYLFPLMTLGLVMAFFYQGAVWKRVLIFASSIPITILMNSLRIAMIGWMVEHWGPGMAEGFLHDFQGWAVFMVSLALMVLLMIGLSFVGRDRRPWRELFGVEFPDPLPKGVPTTSRSLAPTAIAACVVLAAGIGTTAWAQSRDVPVPERQTFADFPMVLGQWLGERRGMSAGDLQVLQLSDYLLATFRGPAPRAVDLYIAWYGSQDKGRYMHSPRTCLPGGGWKILEHTQVDVPGVMAAGQQLRVNRVLMESGTSKTVVYYWFQQRGRVTTNEWLTKRQLLWDSVTTGRSDGALIRLIAPLGDGEQSSNADADLARFATELTSVLDQYVPR